MLKLYQVDAFCDALFKGNPAAVVPLDAWPQDSLLQSIAAENNLAETAFLVPAASAWELRWFTPKSEVDLCGHATLAAAYVLVNHYKQYAPSIDFATRKSGVLSVRTHEDGTLSMSFPSIALQAQLADAEQQLVKSAVGVETAAILKGHYSEQEYDYVVVLDDEKHVQQFIPDVARFTSLDSRGVIVTASGQGCDFVSRYFAPNVGIDEDPVTGSAHCLLAPHWAQQLGKTTLQAKQLSARGGDLICEVKADRVVLTGRAVLYMEGTLVGVSIA